ncbi:hypothetical protein [Bacillus sp. FJAT-44742]|uniref:hypothetical protein n=1 Tax=Bacillus sp. FJAT-44742 TaxID=2014005 RepID=UPI000C230AA0|nr:hypothetical protein [Bacillus sp. FJAT-44742]
MGQRKSKKSKTAVKVSPAEKHAHTMKVVTSETCFSCKKQCARGIAYMEKMSQPGAIGKGVPCILTKGRAPGRR